MTDVTKMRNPFRSEYEGEPTDQDLVAAAVGGDRRAIEALVLRTRWREMNP